MLPASGKVTMVTVTNTRRLEDRDIEPVLELMRLSLGESSLLARTPALFQWKHLDNPFGRSIALVAEEDDRIVGLRTFMRWDLQIPDGGLLKCVRAVDTATHPDYQRRGIFRRLTEEGVEIASAEGIDLVFNTPNELSKPGYLKMGWQEVGRIGAMVRPSLILLRPGPSSDSTTAEEYLREPIQVLDPRHGDRPARGARTPRSADYLQWRFASHPTARYYLAEADGAAAILRPNRRNGRSELVLADTFGNPGKAIGAAVRAKRSAYLATWFSSGSPEKAAAIRHGFVPIPGYRALTLVMRPLGELPLDLTMMRGWDLAVSDLELL